MYTETLNQQLEKPNQNNTAYLKQLRQSLTACSSAETALSMTRFFNHEVNFIGVKAADIKQVIHEFQQQHVELSAEGYLSLTEYILTQAHYTEEVLLAFGLINKFVKRHFSDDLLLRFEFWLEHYATNWSHVDDLCIKTLYQFMLARPHLIENTQHWALSNSPWCRRASCVAWVKFVKRKIGRSVYRLDLALILNHCDGLLNDPDPFVQKSVGWLLKVTSVEHEAEVIAYLKANRTNMQRSTVRYAIEKLTPAVRKSLLAYG
ncbi:DNA alkylation repair protein [Shewanella youngdeokensis]|uniref:DNA alkylation repair protein n=1 Tax=Shewanella youngdeokensis TaxID=2999068 RepID=A0ABZ0K2I5_9GAMM|nr:DNA alkylation repair protein [Shewanella sp. DAU334]